MEKNHDRLFFLFPSLEMDIKGRSLEAILSYADRIDNLFQYLKGIDLLLIIATRNEECQIYILGILSRLVPKLTVNEVGFFLETVINTYSPNFPDRLRNAFYILLYRLDSHQSVLTKSSSIAIKCSLLKGLTDSNESIRNSLTDYLNNTVMSGIDIFTRMNEIIRLRMLLF